MSRRGRFGYLSLWSLLIVVSLISRASSSQPVRVGNLEAELVSEVTAIKAGQPFWAALRLNLDEHWHVYWENAGDAGIPPKLTWRLPEGFAVDDILWPVPEKIDVPPLTSFGYHGEILLPVQVTPPLNLNDGESITLTAKAEWLVCKEACIPGEAELTLTLKTTHADIGIDQRWMSLFNETRCNLPISLPELAWRLSAVNGEIMLTTPLATDEQPIPDSVYFFPREKAVVDYAAPQMFVRDDSSLTLVLKRSIYNAKVPDTITGVLFAARGWRGENAEKGLNIVAVASAKESASAAITSNSESVSLFQALLFAFLGGIILNLMPCVLPVLSIKILSFVNQAGQERHKIFQHGLIFTSGVLLSFLILAGALLLLRAGGQELGWGFQLQSPAFIMVIASFMFLFGLSMMGVFEISSSLGSMTVSSGRTGALGSFLNGVTATVVATPCTAPFMGSALGFSLTQPAWIALLIFSFLGLGMAAPYLILSASPALLRFVPKPGRWMETLKQFMGFLLMATVVWLGWVLGIQAGAEALVILLSILLLLGIAGWVLGRWGTITQKPGVKISARLSALLVTLAAFWLGMTGVENFQPGASPKALTDDGTLAWQEFSPEIVEQHLAQGSPVFIDFTAAWCLSCQVNERVAFSSEEVQRKFAELKIIPLKADWTNRSETITRALAKFGRNSVPLYVLYLGGRENPIILPEILTPGIVLEALDKIKRTDRMLAHNPDGAK